MIGSVVCDGDAPLNAAPRPRVQPGVSRSAVVLAIVLVAFLPVAQGQDAAPPVPTRAELVRLRASAALQIRWGTCVEPAREVRDTIDALRGARGVTRRALLAYLATERERLSRCSMGSAVGVGVVPGPYQPPQPRPHVDGRVTVLQVRAVAPEGRDPTSFERHVRIHRAEVRWCYERELQRDPELRGTAELRAVVEADGRIAEVELIRQNGSLVPVLECVRPRIARRRVASYQGGEVAGTYVWRIGFEPDAP